MWKNYEIESKSDSLYIDQEHDEKLCDFWILVKIFTVPKRMLLINNNYKLK